ncbi:unnamed protein product [Withania somnifera]
MSILPSHSLIFTSKTTIKPHSSTLLSSKFTNPSQFSVHSSFSHFNDPLDIFVSKSTSNKPKDDSNDKPISFIDEWGEKSGPELRPITKLSDSDPPIDIDEWGKAELGSNNSSGIEDEWGEKKVPELRPEKTVSDSDPPIDEDEWMGAKLRKLVSRKIDRVEIQGAKSDPKSDLIGVSIPDSDSPKEKDERVGAKVENPDTIRTRTRIVPLPFLVPKLGKLVVNTIEQVEIGGGKSETEPKESDPQPVVSLPGSNSPEKDERVGAKVEKPDPNQIHTRIARSPSLVPELGKLVVNTIDQVENETELLGKITARVVEDTELVGKITAGIIKDEAELVGKATAGVVEDTEVVGKITAGVVEDTEVVGKLSASVVKDEAELVGKITSGVVEDTVVVEKIAAGVVEDAEVAGKIMSGVVKDEAELVGKITAGVAEDTEVVGKITAGVVKDEAELVGKITAGVVEDTEVVGKIIAGVVEDEIELVGEITTGVVEAETELVGKITAGVVENLTLVELKKRLIDMVNGTDFGLRASSGVRAEVLELVAQLEAANPTPNPVDSPELLDGNWILVFTAFSELLPLLAVGTIPLLKVEKISQVISTSSLTIENSATLSIPAATLSFSATATFEVRSPSRIQVEFKEGTLKPPEIKLKSSLPENLDIFGQDISLSAVHLSLNPLDSVVAAISRTISGLPPLKVPIPGERTKSWLITTYLDKHLRISRGDGGLFVLVKEETFLPDLHKVLHL